MVLNRGLRCGLAGNSLVGDVAGLEVLVGQFAQAREELGFVVKSVFATEAARR